MILKRKILITVFNAILVSAFGQSYVSKTIQHDGKTRQYDIYIPAIYDGSSAVPLIFNFHGGNGDIASQIAISDMSTIADVANFIAVYPQALPDPNDGGSTNWLHKDPSTANDVLFIEALIETLSNDYKIDLNRIYACGYSLGGEFTYELACKLSSKIAAIGVVARTMQAWTLDDCSPSHPTGVITILGTDDPISDYNGVSFGGIQYYISADEVHDYWIDHNNCNNIPNITQLPDSNTSDGSRVEHSSWANAEDCVYIEHLKIIGGGHDWPGSFGNMDINATEEIWNFVSKYQLTGNTDCRTSETFDTENTTDDYVTYPNPFQNHLTIRTNLSATKEFRIYTTLGELIITGKLNSNLNRIDLSTLAPNIYILKLGTQPVQIIKMH